MMKQAEDGIWIPVLTKELIEQAFILFGED